MNPSAPLTLDLPLPSVSTKSSAPEPRVLRRAQALSLIGCHSLQCIRVLEGKLWITQEGDPEDYIIGPGQTYSSSRRGKVVVESLTSDARFVLSPAPV